MSPKELVERAIEETKRLPEVIVERFGQHATLRVGKKVFGYVMNDHHGDGVTGICCKVLPGESEMLMASGARRFYRPAYTRAGWVGLRLDVGRVSWREVHDLLECSYRLTAGKRQLELLDASAKGAK